MGLLLRYPLRYLLPAAVAGFALLIAVTVYLNTRASANTQVEQQAVDEIRANMVHLQGGLQLLLRTGNLDGARSIIASLGATAGLEALLLTDEDGVVLAATELAALGKRLADVHQELGRDANRPAKRGGIDVNISDDRRRVFAYAPICGAPKPATLRPTRCGLLSAVHGLEQRKAAALDTLRAQAVKAGPAILAVSGLLWALLHLLFNRRIVRLITTARSFAGGDPQARAHLEGKDELAAVGTAFDALLDRVVDEQVAVEDSEARFRDFADTAADWFWEMDADLRFTHASGRFENILGITADDIIGKTRREVHVGPRYDANAWAPHFEALQSRRPFYGFEVPWTQPGGEARTLQISGKPLFDVNGEFRGYRGTGRDVTELRRAEAALRESHALLEQRVKARTGELAASNRRLEAENVKRRRAENQFRSFLESAPDATVIVDAQGLVRFINVQTERLFGYDRGELLGQPVERLIPERFAARHAEDRHRYVEAPRPRSMGIGLALWGRTKDGREVPVEVSLSPIHDVEPVMVSATVRDISARKQAEGELRQALADVEQANRSKSRFLAAASHDLRQPLQSLGMYLSVLRRRIERTEDQKIIDSMAQSLDTMGELLDALLDISKLDAGGIEPRVTDFAVQDLLDRVVADNTPHAQRKGLELRVVSSSCTARSDPALLERIVGNFVANAIRYTTAGRILVGCRRAGSHVRIEVWDTGLGIPEDALQDIFREYYQVDNSARDRAKGLGLGLAIVERIAKLLGHHIDVASTPGRGSVFAIEIPQGASAAGPPLVREQTAQAAACKRVSVLFVDDDPAIVSAMQLLMESMGFEIKTAMNGAQALAVLTPSPDVIVSDFRLPRGETGVEVIRRVREIVGADLPAIILTGDTSNEQVESTDLTDCRVLHKPVNGDDLLRVIAEVSREACPDSPASSQP